MKILIAGATGVIGRQLVPKLLANGHEVAGTTTAPSKQSLLKKLGARPFVVDILDADAVAATVLTFGPDVIVHEATSLGSVDYRHFARSFAHTNRLRTEGTDHLLAAGRTAGIRRFVAQSFAGWPYERSGSLVKTEDDPLDPNPIDQMKTTIEAIRYLEARVLGAGWTEGIALRYGGLYGPGTSLDADGGELTQMIRRRFFPIIGDGEGMISFIHVADAADATLVAVEQGTRGVYNIVDDEPAAMRDWVPVAAASLGAKPPFRIPLWLGRLVGGEMLTVMATETRGASNARAKRVLGWRPSHPSWRNSLGREAA